MRNTFDVPVIGATPDDGHFYVIILAPGEQFLVDISEKRGNSLLCQHLGKKLPETHPVIVVNSVAEFMQKNRLDVVRVPQYEISSNSSLTDSLKRQYRLCTSSGVTLSFSAIFRYIRHVKYSLSFSHSRLLLMSS